jgi:hypothetical protein
VLSVEAVAAGASLPASPRRTAMTFSPITGSSEVGSSAARPVVMRAPDDAPDLFTKAVASTSSSSSTPPAPAVASALAAFQAALDRHPKPEPEDDFWETLGEGAYELTEQPRTAIYHTASGHVGLRQENSFGDDDAVVIIDPQKAEGVARAILAVARAILQSRGGK